MRNVARLSHTSMGDEERTWSDAWPPIEICKPSAGVSCKGSAQSADLDIFSWLFVPSRVSYAVELSLDPMDSLSESAKVLSAYHKRFPIAQTLPRSIYVPSSVARWYVRIEPGTVSAWAHSEFGDPAWQTRICGLSHMIARDPSPATLANCFRSSRCLKRQQPTRLTVPREGHRGQSHSLFLRHISHLGQQGFTFIHPQTPSLSGGSLLVWNCRATS